MYSMSLSSESNDSKKRKRSDSKRCSEADDNNNARPKSSAVNGRNSNVDCFAEWPPAFKIVDKTHRALNLVYTFCSTRKQLATTFDNLKAAVESHTQKPLTIENVAAVVAIRPEAITFSYVDETTLRAELDDTEGPDYNTNPGLGRDGPIAAKTRPSGENVLLLQFTDGDLKRQVTNKMTGQPTNPRRRLRNEPLKMPVFSQKQVMRLIERRNARFKCCIEEFIKKCAANHLDPEEALRTATQAHLPALPDGKQSAVSCESKIPDIIPKFRKDIPEIVQEIKDSTWYTGQIVPDGHRVFEPQEAVYGDLDFLLSQDLVNAIYNAKGITKFYVHQAEALNYLHAGRHVVVATSTSSGKSLIYQIPVIYALEKDHNSRAMYIFPTKALAQDQKRSIKEILKYLQGLEDTLVETFDGDTPMDSRNAIREEARILFTNPDMLHVTILPQEQKWRTFLKNLKFVVVDELHYYNGHLGAHVAYIMRRLRRICSAVGNRRVKFISCSATVANPREHFCTIFGVDNVKLVDFDGSPSERKEYLCWNTPYKDPRDPASGRGNAKFECARLFCQLILRGLRTIAFCRVRAQCEALVGAVKQELKALGREECAGRVMGYRGGYTAQDRRMIESEMFEGKLLGIIATTALELGIDIGTLDCVLTWGFPYSIANLRQQSGRAGRRNRDSLSILVGDSFPTDQHYMQNPNELFTKPNSQLQVDLENVLVLEGHLQCAAFEMPIQPKEDGQYFGRGLAKICGERLIRDEAGFFHCHDRYRPSPSRFVTIRDTEDERFAIIDVTGGKNTVLEELEASRATFTIYDGSIFLHQGNKYLVRDFRPDERIAKVELVKVEWTTLQRDYTDIDPVETEAVKRITGSRCQAFYGTIKIQQNVFGYFKQDRAGRVLDAIQVDNPPVIRYGKGMWLDVPKEALDLLSGRRLHPAAAIHAAEHAVMSLMPTYVISMPGDVRTECKEALKEFSTKETSRKRPGRLTFYDAKGGAGGIGVNTKAFEYVDMLLQRALKRVEGCGCELGCLECVASESCHKSNQVMSKAGSRVILRSLLGLSIDVDSLPMGPEEHSPVGVETVVLARSVPPKFCAPS